MVQTPEHRLWRRWSGISYLLLPLSTCLQNKPQPRVVTLLHMMYSVPREALKETALNERSVVMPWSWGSMCSCRESARPLSLQSSRTHGKERENWKVIQGEPYGKDILRHTVTKRVVKNTLDTFTSSGVCRWGQKGSGALRTAVTCRRKLRRTRKALSLNQ